MNEQRIHEQNAAFEAAIDDEPLERSLGLLARIISQEIAGARVAFLIADPSGARLRPVWGAATMPDAFLKRIDARPSESDPPTRGPAEPDWAPGRDVAEAFGFRGGWSFPITTRARHVVGALALYVRDPREATLDELALAETATHVAAAVIAHHAETEERARAEHALREREARLRDALEIETVGVIFYDELGQVTDVNEAFRRFARVSRRQMATGALHWRDLTAREWWPAVRALFAALANGQRAAPHERQFLRRDGERRWGLVAPMRLADGRIVEYVLDVTERKRAEAALRASEARYRGLFTSIDEGYGLYEVIRAEAGEPLDIRVREVNPAYERLMRRPNAAGQVLTALDPNLQHEWVEMMAEVATSGAARRFERHNPALDRWFDVLVTPVDHDERHIALLFNDITERKRAEAALRENKERQAFLLRLSDALRPLSDPVAIQNTASCLLVEQLNVDRALYTEVIDEATAVKGDVARDAPLPAARPRAADVGEAAIAAYRANQPFIVNDVAADSRFSEAERAAYLAIGIRANLSVGLVKDGRWVAAFGVHHALPRRWTEADRALVTDVAERTWAAVARARAESGQRESEARHRFLVLFGDTLRALAGETDVLQTASRLLGEHLNADRAFFGELHENEDVAIMLPDYARGDLPSLAGRYHISDFQETVDALKHGHPYVIDDVARAEQLSEQTRAAYLELGYASFFSVPLFTFGALSLNLSAVSSHPRHWAPGDVQLAQDVAERTWTVVERIRAEGDRRRSEDALRASEASLQRRVAEATTELRDLSRRLLQVQEDERRRLALELHDEIGQMLTGLTIQLASIEEGERLAEARATLTRLIEQVRQLSVELRPAELDRYGLLSASRALIERYQRHTGFAVDLRHAGVDGRFPPPVEIAVYRIVQEALTNIARHAGVDRAEVRLFADDAMLTVSIRDEGRGFDLAAPGGSGLGGMRERAELLGGTLTVDNEPGVGVTITAELPFETSASDQEPAS